LYALIIKKIFDVSIVDNSRIVRQTTEYREKLKYQILKGGEKILCNFTNKNEYQYDRYQLVDVDMLKNLLFTDIDYVLKIADIDNFNYPYCALSHRNFMPENFQILDFIVFKHIRYIVYLHITFQNL